jgi:hypothetical protein
VSELYRYAVTEDLHRDTHAPFVDRALRQPRWPGPWCFDAGQVHNRHIFRSQKARLLAEAQLPEAAWESEGGAVR